MDGEEEILSDSGRARRGWYGQPWETQQEKAEKYKSMLCQLHSAAETLCNQIERVNLSPEYISVWTIAQQHQGEYAGPQFTKELASLVRLVEAYKKEVAEVCLDIGS